MSEEEFIIALVGIVFGTVIAGIFIGGFFQLIKTWINRKKSDTELDPRFFKALSEFKRNTEQRLANLEAIVTDEKEEDLLDSNRLKVEKEEAPSIEIEEKEIRKSKKEEKESGNLKNMLDE